MPAHFAHGLVKVDFVGRMSNSCSASQTLSPRIDNRRWYRIVFAYKVLPEVEMHAVMSLLASHSEFGASVCFVYAPTQSLRRITKAMNGEQFLHAIKIPYDFTALRSLFIRRWSRSACERGWEGFVPHRMQIYVPDHILYHLRGRSRFCLRAQWKYVRKGRLVGFATE